MADDAKQETPAAPAVVTSKSREKSADETMPGGRYVDAQGNYVNAHGAYIDGKGNVVEEPVKAPTK